MCAGSSVQLSCNFFEVLARLCSPVQPLLYNHLNVAFHCDSCVVSRTEMPYTTTKIAATACSFVSVMKQTSAQVADPFCLWTTWRTDTTPPFFGTRGTANYRWSLISSAYLYPVLALFQHVHQGTPCILLTLRSFPPLCSLFGASHGKLLLVRGGQSHCPYVERSSSKVIGRAHTQAEHLACWYVPWHQRALLDTDHDLIAWRVPWHAQDPLQCSQRLGFHAGDARNHRHVSCYTTLPRETTACEPPSEHVHRCYRRTREIESRESSLNFAVSSRNLMVDD